jgi:hypothetical protein
MKSSIAESLFTIQAPMTRRMAPVKIPLIPTANVMVISYSVIVDRFGSVFFFLKASLQGF